MNPFQYCENIARHDENFPVGWFVPKSVRKYIYALYAFARTADDFADEPQFAEERMSRLEEWSERLKKASRGEADHPLFEALAITFRETSLPPQLLADLLTAFRMDLTKSRYKDYSELEQYCQYSANPIGRAVLILYGHEDPRLLELSDRICTGIQLVNHWQDIGIDLEKDRVYLPHEDLRRFGYSYDDLQERRVNDSFRDLLRFEIGRTRDLFYAGQPLFNFLSRRLRWQVELMWTGPLKILERIELADYDIFRLRPTLNKIDFLRLFAQNRLGRISR
ncbi:MAG: squalene synthase HpnC [Deltaproteobacteria bacterium]|nr:squalene synthase HpnC [Deltaproteobacteria bacterium]